MEINRKLSLLLCVGTFVIALLVSGSILSANSENTTSVLIRQASTTPLRVVLPTQTTVVTEGIVLSPTPTFTPSSEGPLQLTVRGDSPVNVRSQADIESQQLGTIRPGETYTVLGRLFMWYQIIFESSPNGRGWVFVDLVEILGDDSLVNDLSQVTQEPLIDTRVVGATQTQAAFNQIPGAPLTATAEARVIAPPLGQGDDDTQIQSSLAGNQLPTFTYPANISAQAPTLMSAQIPTTPSATPVVVQVSEGVAPIVPIVILVGFGLLGLMIGILRR